MQEGLSISKEFSPLCLPALCAHQRRAPSHCVLQEDEVLEHKDVAGLLLCPWRPAGELRVPRASVPQTAAELKPPEGLQALGSGPPTRVMADAFITSSETFVSEESFYLTPGFFLEKIFKWSKISNPSYLIMKTLTFYEVKKKKNPLLLMTCFQSTFQTAPLLVSRYSRGRTMDTAALCHPSPRAHPLPGWAWTFTKTVQPPG